MLEGFLLEIIKLLINYLGEEIMWLFIVGFFVEIMFLLFGMILLIIINSVEIFFFDKRDIDVFVKIGMFIIVMELLSIFDKMLLIENVFIEILE